MEFEVLNNILSNTIVQFCYGEPMRDIDFSIQMDDISLQQEQDDYYIIQQSNNSNQTAKFQMQKPQCSQFQNQPINNSDSVSLKFSERDSLQQKQKSSNTVIIPNQPLPQIQGNSLNITSRGSHNLTTQLSKNNTIVSSQANECMLWVETNGPLKLKESLELLNTTEIALKTRYSNLSIKDLQKEKKVVKNQLKKYDQSFAIHFKRQPQCDEKEPLRSLYIYYKKLKQQIQILQKENIETLQTGASQRSVQVQGDVQPVNQQPLSQQQNAIQQINANPIVQQKDRSTEQNNADVQQTLKNNQQSQKNNIQAQKNNVLDPLVRNKQGGKIPKELPYKMKQLQQQLQGMETREIQKTIDELKQIRQKLRDKLHVYQIEFNKNNNRKIKYHNDIGPVEADYKKYKEVKFIISKIEEHLNNKTAPIQSQNQKNNK